MLVERKSTTTPDVHVDTFRRLWDMYEKRSELPRVARKRKAILDKKLNTCKNKKIVCRANDFERIS